MKNLLLFFVLICSSIGFAQERATIALLREQKQAARDYAEDAIVRLNDGSLLVRLNYKKKQTTHYDNIGQESAAKKIRDKQIKKNMFVIQAFREHYDFSDVYFFAMGDSRTLLEEGPDAITFYNDAGEPDSSISISGEYFIAEFGNLQPDTTYYLDNRLDDTSKENPKQDMYYTTGSSNRQALVIMDHRFKQTAKPFPYFAPFSDMVALKTRYIGPVQKLNRRLHNYFDTTTAKVDE